MNKAKGCHDFKVISNTQRHDCTQIHETRIAIRKSTKLIAFIYQKYKTIAMTDYGNSINDQTINYSKRLNR